MVSEAIDSALAWLAAAEAAGGEIVVVDDASTDGTVEALERRFRQQIATGQLRLISARQNLGVTGAKNLGGAEARGEWLIFLDSDDRLVTGSAAAVGTELGEAEPAPVVFFRCVERESGELLGEPASAREVIDLKRLLTGWRWGECLPVVRRSAFERFPYEASLRGYEGIAYARMCRYFAPALMSPTVARVYDTSGDDRLSTAKARRRRAAGMAAGHGTLLREFGGELGLAARLRLAVSWLYYRILS